MNTSQNECFCTNNLVPKDQWALNYFDLTFYSEKTFSFNISSLDNEDGVCAKMN